MLVSRVLKAGDFMDLYDLTLGEFLIGLSRDVDLLLYSSETLKSPYLNERLGLTDDFALFINRGKSKEKTIHIFLPFLPPNNNDGNFTFHEFAEFSSFLRNICRDSLEIALDFSRTKMSTVSSLEDILAKKLSFIDVSSVLDAYFSLKTEEEIRAVRKACAFTDRIFEQVCQKIKGFELDSEKAVFDFIKHEANKKSCQLAFNPIIANGQNSSFIHYPFYSKKLFKKGFLLLDFGLRCEGFCSDMTRMLYFGKPSAKERDDFEFVRAVKRKCISRADKQSSAKDFQGYAMSLFEEKGYDLKHGIAHGIGAFVHEPLFFLPSSLNRKGNVLAIEPGIYLDGKYGIRLEDTVLIKEGVERLTKSSDDLVVIER